MEKVNAVTLKPYNLDTALTGYMPIPRDVIAMDLPSTATLIYGALLDRATLSRKNHYADETGWVYVIYPVEHLAETFQISDTAVKRHLKELEHQGLIFRRRERGNGPNHIYVSLPAGSIQGTDPDTKCTPPGAKSSPPTGRKVPSNNRKEQHNNSNYYQHGEDESL